jgi:hypothetical protein
MKLFRHTGLVIAVFWCAAMEKMPDEWTIRFL